MNKVIHPGGEHHSARRIPIARRHRRKVADIDPLPRMYNPEGGWCVLGKVEQREGAGSVEESFLFGPRNFHPFHFSFQPSLPPARLHSTLLYESLSLRFIRLSIHPSPPLSLPTRPDHSLAHVFGLRYHVSCRSRSIARTVFHVYNGTFVILVNQPSADLGQILAQAVYKGCPKIYAGFELNITESL